MTMTLDAWGEVLSHLGVRAYDPGGLVGACLAARWLGTAAAVCRDLRVAARGAMADLGAAVSEADIGELLQLGPEGVLWGVVPQSRLQLFDPTFSQSLVVDHLLRRPSECTVVQLLHVTEGLGLVTRARKKAELVAMLMRELRLPGPVPEHVPPRLVLRAYLERTRWTRKRGALLRPFDAEVSGAISGLRCAKDPRVSPPWTRDIYDLPCLVDLQVALCRAFPVGGEEAHRRVLVGAWREQEPEARAAELRLLRSWFGQGSSNIGNKLM